MEIKEKAAPVQEVWFHIFEVPILKPNFFPLTVSIAIVVVVWAVMIASMELLSLPVSNEVKMASLLATVWGPLSANMGVLVKDGSPKMLKIYWIGLFLSILVGYGLGLFLTI
jgi:hypothetical protein